MLVLYQHLQKKLKGGTMKNNDIKILNEIRKDISIIKDMVSEIKHDYQTTKNTITQLNVRISEKQAKLI